MKTLLFILFAFTLILYACKDNPTVIEPPVSNTGYKKVMDAVSGSTKFEIYKNGSENLTFGYNEIGFKVFLDNQEQTSGFVKFTPRLYDNVPTPGWVCQSAPVSSRFERDANGYFIGYANFIKATSSPFTWYGFFNYNDQANADSVVFNVNASSQAQLLSFRGPSPDTNWYCITLISPFTPKYGLNEFKCMLHTSADQTGYTEVENAEMIIWPWMPSMNHGSSSNINPTYSGKGVYTGRVNLVMSGGWEVYDTVRVSGNTVTPIPTPKFIFDCP
ncbi:MAG: hypothetical protein EHM58_12645 [Ignavibacteriae bacterium]|nr:MAG: hypothetical protein EHM58_12645 [Ignavibacteriota bacterium]